MTKNTKMDPTIKAQWIAALRSGEYRQGEGVLHNVDNNLFCCLGVLCDLAVKAGVEILVETTEREDGSVTKTCYDDHGEDLPPSVQKWAGLPDEDPHVEYPDEFESEPYLSDTLATLNDGGHTFLQIAKIIEDAL